jgi:hypothetical protein
MQKNNHSFSVFFLFQSSYNRCNSYILHVRIRHARAKIEQHDYSQIGRFRHAQRWLGSPSCDTLTTKSSCRSASYISATWTEGEVSRTITHGDVKYSSSEVSPLKHKSQTVFRTEFENHTQFEQVFFFWKKFLANYVLLWYLFCWIFVIKKVKFGSIKLSAQLLFFNHLILNCWVKKLKKKTFYFIRRHKIDRVINNPPRINLETFAQHNI